MRAPDIDDQIAAVRRQVLAMEHSFARWVGERKMAQADADQQLACIRAALQTLEHVKIEQRPPMFPLASAA